MPDSPNTKPQIKVLPEVEDEASRMRLKTKLDKAVRMFRENPRHTGLHLEKLKGMKDTWSIRLDIHYRALLVRDSEECFIIYQILNHYA